ncbi:MAG: NAD(P)-binding protein [Pseudomonadota bacterium]
MKAGRTGIVGAGLGGPVAAEALQQRGFRVTVYEAAAAGGEALAGRPRAPRVRGRRGGRGGRRRRLDDSGH